MPSIEQQLRRQVSVKLRRAAISVLSEQRAKAATDSIIADLISNTKAEFIPGTGNILGTLRVTIKPGLSESVFTNAEYKSGHHDIPWLTWLLTKGSQVVILDHSVDHTSSPHSRSGKALMVEDEGGLFRVDPKFSGISADNVITRFLKSEVNSILKLMVSEIKKQFK
jgi:hypothetical protein